MDKPAAALFLAMRLGKSRCVVELIHRRQHRRVLILAPKAVAQNVWRGQIEAHWPGLTKCGVLTLAGHETAARKAQIGAERVRQAEARREPLVVVMGYEAAWQPKMAKWLQSVEWDLLVCDESHKIKAQFGTASKFVGKLAQKIPYRLLLTGTPMPQSYLDIWAQYRALDPTIFGNSFVAYRSTYGRAGGYMMHDWKLNPYYADALAAKIYSVAYRVTADVLDMPPALDIPVAVELGATARAAYDTLRKDMILRLRDHTLTPANAMVLLLRLQQITGGTLPTDEGEGLPIDTAKQDALVELLEGLPPGEPVVVFCKFRADLDSVHKAAQRAERRSLELSGRTNDVAAWLDGQAPILACQIQSGGVGLDFSRAAYAVYFSVGYSLGDYEQSRWRLRGSNQTRPVGYYHLIAQRTVDTRVYAGLQAKADMAEFVLRAMERGEEE